MIDVVFSGLKKLYFFICKKFSIKTSFSLIELTVVLFVTGIIIGGGLVAYKSTNPKIKSDLKKIQAIENALQQFFTTNGRLPFPAYVQFKEEDNKYLEEYNTNVYNYSIGTHYCSEDKKGDFNIDFPSCSSGADSSCCPNDFVLWGVVPTRTLGLPDNYAYDSNGHNFEYITHAALAYLNGKKFSTEHKKSSYITDQNGKYVVHFSHDKLEPIIIAINRLSVYNNNNDTEILTTKDNTAYVIISKGQTDKCYFNTKTGEINTTKPSDNTIKNCVQNYMYNSSGNRTIYQGFSKDFNNIVKYKTLSEMIQKSSNIKEDTRILTNRNNAVEYQLKVDDRLVTKSKEVSGAINELSSSVKQVNSMFKVVSTFENEEGDSLILYFLTSSYDDYAAGIYVYQDGKFISLNNSKKNMCNNMYPVGSIYITTDSDLTTNDKIKSKLGCGEWERIECGAILQNAGQTNGSSCVKGMSYESKIYSRDSATNYRDLPVNVTVETGLPNIYGHLGCMFGSPCKDSSCESFAYKAFHGNKACGYTSMSGSGSNMSTYDIVFNAFWDNNTYGNAGEKTVQPFTYTVYMWKRVS